MRNTLHPRRPSPRPSVAIVIACLAWPAATTFAQEQEVPTSPDAPLGAAPSRGVAPESPPPVSAPSTTALEKRIDEINLRTSTAIQALQTAEEARSHRENKAPTVSAEEAGFGIASRDRRFWIHIHGQLQVDGRRFLGDDSLRALDTFLIRRARPTIEVSLAGLADAQITPDFAGGTMQLFDAFIDLHPRPWLRLRAGKFKPPVGLERLQSDNSLVFTERALDQDLSAQRDVGVQLWGDVAEGILRYEAAILNGAPDSALNDVDNDYAKSVAGRVFVQPFASPNLRWLGRLGLGFAAQTADETGSPAISNAAVTGTWLGSFKSIGQNAIFSYSSSTTDTSRTVVSLHRHTRLNPQLYYYYGPLGFEAEYLHERIGVSKGDSEATLENSAGHATLAYVLGGDCRYEGPTVRNPFDLETGGLGALEIGVRYDWLKIDSATFPNFADPAKSVVKAQGIGVALNWYLSKSLRLVATYDQTKFDGGAGSTGAIANRTTEKVFIGRMQVGY